LVPVVVHVTMSPNVRCPFSAINERITSRRPIACARPRARDGALFAFINAVCTRPRRRECCHRSSALALDRRTAADIAREYHQLSARRCHGAQRQTLGMRVQVLGPASDGTHNSGAPPLGSAVRADLMESSAGLLANTQPSLLQVDARKQPQRQVPRHQRCRLRGQGCEQEEPDYDAHHTGLRGALRHQEPCPAMAAPFRSPKAYVQTAISALPGGRGVCDTKGPARTQASDCAATPALSPTGWRRPLGLGYQRNRP